MPVEVLVAAFVIGCFGAIAWRFLPRSADGGRRLPEAIDDSIGMWAIRRATGRRRAGPGDDAGPGGGHAAADPKTPAAASDPSPSHGPARIQPTRFVVSHAPGHRPVERARLEWPPAPTGSIDSGRPRPPAAVPLQRRVAGLTALVLVAITLAGFVLLPRKPQGGVLAVTATPSVSMSPSPTPAPAPGASH